MQGMVQTIYPLPRFSGSPAPFCPSEATSLTRARFACTPPPCSREIAPGVPVHKLCPADNSGSHRMEQAELEGHYERLKDELARAYSSPAWDSPHIDRLTATTRPS